MPKTSEENGRDLKETDLASRTDTAGYYAFPMERRDERVNVLVELRPCFEGFAGIPQETRLVFSTLCKLPSLRIGGLLNTYNGTKRLDIRKDRKPAEASRLYEQAKLIIDIEMANIGRKRGIFAHFAKKLRKKDYGFVLDILCRGGISQEVTAFNAVDFDDFLWSGLFSKTLASAQRQQVLQSEFYHTSLGWKAANKMCRYPRLAPRLNTRGWDIFLSQVPFPGTVAPDTRLVVRYHDAIPIFLSHTIPEPRLHASSHYHALRCNVRRGAYFACTSEPVRQDLLRLFPGVEENTCVIPDIVSPEFRPQPELKRVLTDIARLRACPATQPPKPADLKSTSQRELAPKIEQYILAVSTLEPRKNFALLISAWEQARRRLKQPPKLVLVAHPGWKCDAELASIAAWVKAEELFHLWKVPIEDLRILYSLAHVVVCPSRAEGFDLSGIEAMLCDSPVLASDIPVHRWVYGDAAMYFDPHSSNAMADQLAHLCTLPKNEGIIAELRDRGRKRGALYSPDAVVPKWSALFESIAAKNTTRRESIGVAS